MARRTRRVEEVEFRAVDPSRVVAYMAVLARAGDGWINLIPETAEDKGTTSLGFFTLFGGGSPGTTMCTWVPGRDVQHGGRPTSLGITHATGRRIGTLPSTGIPEHWFVEQDHPRRGLVLNVANEESHEDVLEWALRTTTALCPLGRVEKWRAEVHLPIAEQPRHR
jgi:hypothetical protein